MGEEVLRASLPPGTTVYLWKLSESHQIGVFLEVSSLRHDWLSHWSLVINLTSSPSLLYSLYSNGETSIVHVAKVTCKTILFISQDRGVLDDPSDLKLLTSFRGQMADMGWERFFLELLLALLALLAEPRGEQRAQTGSKRPGFTGTATAQKLVPSSWRISQGNKQGYDQATSLTLGHL